MDCFCEIGENFGDVFLVRKEILLDEGVIIQEDEMMTSNHSG